jgi:hypothetical protein
MKTPAGSLFFAVALALVAPLSAAPGRLDTTKRSKTSTEQKAVLPDQVQMEKNDVLQERRVEREVFSRKDALVGERRSSITVEEGREKTMFTTPDRREYEQIERKDSPWAGKMSKFSTGEDSYRSRVATRFQDKIGDASPINSDAKPVIEQRTTFSRINRFAFRKNGDQTIEATTAGSERPAQDLSEKSGTAPASTQTPTPTSRR